MSNRKINLDRPALSPEQIEARQDFDKVLKQHYLLKPPVWKSPWFWGPTGLASVGIALFLSISYINSQNHSNDKNATLTAVLPPDTECIHAPVKGEDIPFQQFAVDASRDEKIVLPSGTEIGIPAGSLQPSDNGEKVQIEVREFLDKVSAFVAGIPMDYGKDAAFESAGMIEIRGTQNGDVVAINPEKPLDVEMKLTKDPSGFDFWYLDERQKDWKKHPASYETEKAPAVTTKAVDKESLKKEIATTEHRIEAVEAQKAAIKKPGIVDYKLPEENHQRFDLDFNKKTYPELAKFENLVFEIIPTSGYDRNFTKKTWSEVKLEKSKDNYEMLFTAPNEKMKVAVRPVLQGKELKAAQHEFDVAMEDYKQTIVRLESEKTALESERDAARKQLYSRLDAMPQPASTAQSTASFQVNLWGAYNCDKPNRYPQAMQEPVFAWEGTTSAAEFTSLFVFNLDKDMRFSYGERARRTISDFGLHASDQVVIFGIARDGSYGYCELKTGKAKNEQSKFVFSKREDEASVKKILDKLIDETVSV